MLASLSQQIREFWLNQPLSRRITIIVLMVATIAAVVVFVSWSTQPSYSVAFSGLNEEDAGLITQKLQDQGIPYKLRSTSTILVPTDRVYEVRLSMATAGLPKTSAVGFELFNTNALIMTEFTQQVNYQRALEGELERTIGSLDAVQAVRVHIVIPEQKLLTSEQMPTTASVTIQIKPGQSLDQNQVRAITHLVASSVEGLKSQDVVVVDSEGNMLAGGDDTGDTAALSQADSHRAMELAAAQTIKKNVQNMLDTVLGPNRSVVQANVVMDWTTSETVTKTYEPTQNPVVSSQKVSESYTTTGDTGGIPGASSNLPQPTLQVTTMAGVLNYQKNEETLNYQITSTESHVTSAPGQVKQLSLSVLVDGVDDADQLAALKNAVIAAAGADVTVRGDLVSVESLAFDRTYVDQQNTEIKNQTQAETYYRIFEIAIPVLIVIILLFFLWRLFRNLRLASGEAWMPVLKPVAEAAFAAPISQPMIPSGVEQAEIPSLPPEQAYEEPVFRPEPEPVAPIPLPPLPKIEKPQITPEEEQLKKVITRLAEDNPASVAEIIQIWLNEDKG